MIGNDLKSPKSNKYVKCKILHVFKVDFSKNGKKSKKILSALTDE